MSYILDALKKASEQRNAPGPEVRRLLGSAPVVSEWPLRTLTVGAAVTAAAGLVLVVWLWQSSPLEPPSSQPIAAVNTVAPTATAVTPAPAAPAVATPPAAGAPRPAPKPPEPTPPLATARPASTPTPTPAVAAPRAVDTTRPSAARPAQRPADSPSVRPAAPPIVAAVPPSAPTPPAAAAPRAERSSTLKLEVIVYSDERPKRFVFINGRKYVEGDAVAEGARIEEIQANAVVITEDGRRVTLRP
jgi:hypothetical protein